MKQELRLQQNNEGFSLVELIVTILISSVVMMAVVGLLTTGLNLYKNVNAETQLQTEGQAACGRINELVQETQYLHFYSNEGADDGADPLATLVNNKVLVLMTLEGSSTGWWYYIVWDAGGKMLMLPKEPVSVVDPLTGALNTPTETDILNMVSDMTNATQKKKYLLAQYIEKFNFKEIDAKLYYLDVTLATGNKEFATDQFISERNK